MRVGLVGCVKTKLEQAARAQDLYTSRLFLGRRAFVTQSCDRWYILSARHGLVEPTDVLKPYEDTLKGKSADVKRSWAASVLRAIETVDLPVAETTFEIHAGAEYRDFGLVDGLVARGARVEVPAEHLTQGAQLSFYAQARPDPSRRTPSSFANVRPVTPARGSSYAPLAEHLAAANDNVETLSFAQLERVLGRPLPASARRHRAWWSNESSGTHTHAAAWMGAGWVADAIDLDSGVVTFRRGRR